MHCKSRIREENVLTRIRYPMHPLLVSACNNMKIETQTRSAAIGHGISHR